MINATKDAYNAAERKLRTGFVAQEVEKAAQSLNYDFDGVNHPQNEKDNYSLVYADFVPSLVKAVQELSKMNDEMLKKDAEKDAVIQQLNDRITKLELAAGVNNSVSATTDDKLQTINSNTARIEQNMPNPFNQSTVIRFFIPSTAKQAQIIITDMSGKTVKREILNGKERGQININAGELAAGTYAYTLYVDGRRIDTKTMVLLAKY